MKTELAPVELKNAETRPTEKKMKLRTILCKMKNTVITLNLLDYMNDSPFLTVN